MKNRRQSKFKCVADDGKMEGNGPVPTRLLLVCRCQGKRLLADMLFRGMSARHCGDGLIVFCVANY